ncbi:hypothetical protein AAFP94_14765 [Flavobacteriaceae bacterium MJ-SS4]|uniref:hypothetical protein n=1 Tax=Gilvirhabdus luticola TaxID=3079858 RepID=UPI0032DC17EB
MISSQRITVSLLLCIIGLFFSFNSTAQQAVLFNFEFQVPEDYRRAIQQYDGGGNKKYKKDLYSNKMILDKSVETLSKKEVNKVCEMAAEMFKQKYGYSEVTMIYPLYGYNGFNRLDDFPNLKFKKAVKKKSADVYIAMEIKIESKEPFVQWSDVLGPKTLEEFGVEKIMFMDVTATYTIYNPKEDIIDQKKLMLTDLTDDLNTYFIDYPKEMDEKGRYKLLKPYFSKSDIIGIYTIVEQNFKNKE